MKRTGQLTDVTSSLDHHAILATCVALLIEQEQVFLGWTVIHAIAAHSSPYPGTIRTLQRAVLSTDFGKLYQEDATLSSVALNTASALMIWKNNSQARRHLECQFGEGWQS